MGVQVALARIGSQAAYTLAIPVAKNFHLDTPVLIGLVLLVGGLIAFFAFSVLDKKLDKQIKTIRLLSMRRNSPLKTWEPFFPIPAFG